MATRRFSIQLFMQDLASQGLKKIDGLLGSIARKTAGMGGSAGGGLGQKLLATPGGFGGFVSQLIRGSAQILLLPVKILAAFVRLIPQIGGVLSGLVTVAANILSGLVTVAANIVGGMVNAFVGLVRGVTKIFQKVLSVAGQMLGRLVGVTAKVGLGAGAVLGYMLFKGIKENMELADLRAVMKKVFGDTATEYEDLARKLSLATPFTPMEAIRSVVSLGAGKLDVKNVIGDVFDLAAATKGLGVRLEDVVNVFVRMKSGGFGEAFARLRESMTISQKELIDKGGLKFNKSGQFMGSPDEAIAGVVRVIRQRFGGMAKEAATVGSGPMSTLIGYWQELRRQATEAIYDVSNGLTTRLSGALEKVLASKSWAQFLSWIGTVSKAIADGLISKVEQLWGWISTRDWSWAGLTARIDDVKGLLATMWDGLLDAGKDAWDGIVAMLPSVGAVMLANVAVWWAQLKAMARPYALQAKAAALGLVRDIMWALAKALGEAASKMSSLNPLKSAFEVAASGSRRAGNQAGWSALGAKREAKLEGVSGAAEMDPAYQRALLAREAAKAKMDAAWAGGRDKFASARTKAGEAMSYAPEASDLVAARPGAHDEIARRKARADQADQTARAAEWYNRPETQGMVREMQRRGAQAQRYEQAAEGAGSQADRQRLLAAAEAEREKAAAVNAKYQEQLGKIVDDQTVLFKSMLGDLTEMGKAFLDRTAKNVDAIKRLADEVKSLKKLARARA